MTRILYGDCREMLRELISEGTRARMCVTSPPYWGLRSYLPEDHPDKAMEIGLEATPEAYVETLVEVFGLVREVLTDDGTLWLNLGDSYMGSGGPGGQYKNPDFRRFRNPNRSRSHRTLKPKDLVGIPWRTALALQADGWWLRSDVIWAKTVCLPEPVRDRPTKSHEYLFLLSKSRTYFYDGPSIAEGQRNRRTVWMIPPGRSPAGGNVAAFPPELIEPCILAGSRPGDMVLDPFIGSGTTAEVCRRLGRKCIGIEINREYERLIDARAGRGGR